MVKSEGRLAKGEGRLKIFFPSVKDGKKGEGEKGKEQRI
jgi:hypothetical protein